MQANVEGELEDWRIHDIRRTVATGLERLGVKQQVVEALLNHTAGSKAGISGVYQRYAYETEKREALDAWAKHVASVVRPSKPNLAIVTPSLPAQSGPSRAASASLRRPRADRRSP